jgi:hypothetical protein
LLAQEQALSGIQCRDNGEFTEHWVEMPGARSPGIDAGTASYMYTRAQS